MGIQCQESARVDAYVKCLHHIYVGGALYATLCTFRDISPGTAWNFTACCVTV